ncbi:MAG: hypothetical protein ABIA04_00370 [Pseudomonadota bacterium]
MKLLKIITIVSFLFLLLFQIILACPELDKKLKMQKQCKVLVPDEMLDINPGILELLEDKGYFPKERPFEMDEYPVVRNRKFLTADFTEIPQQRWVEAEYGDRYVQPVYRQVCDPDVYDDVWVEPVFRRVCTKDEYRRIWIPAETKRVCWDDKYERVWVDPVYREECTPDVTKRVCHDAVIKEVCTKDVYKQECKVDPRTGERKCRRVLVKKGSCEKRVVKEAYCETIIVQRGECRRVEVRPGHYENRLVKRAGCDDRIIREGYYKNELIRRGECHDELVRAGHYERRLISKGICRQVLVKEGYWERNVLLKPAHYKKLPSRFAAEVVMSEKVSRKGNVFKFDIEKLFDPFVSEEKNKGTALMEALMQLISCEELLALEEESA